jgi:enoyl-CoA hydratase/carnithine racemase
MMASSSDPVGVSVEDGIATVTIRRPQRRNALDGVAWARLFETFDGLRGAASVRAAILTGAEGHFCAGDDIVEYAKLGDLPEAQAVDAKAAYGARIVQVYEAIKECGVPVYAAIDGYCIGGGCSLAMACDFRIAAPDARFGIPAVRLGIMYSPELCRRLAGLVGLSHARRWLLEGERIDTAEARAIGFVDAVADDPFAEATARARRLAQGVPLPIAGTKLILNALHDDRLDERAGEIADAFARCAASADAREAAAAFRDKRTPRFTGR